MPFISGSIPGHNLTFEKKKKNLAGGGGGVGVSFQSLRLILENNINFYNFILF